MPSREPTALDDAALLEAWEGTSGLARPWREIGLLAAACDERPEQLARLPIGERDRLILALRQQTFGTRLDCETVCAGCGERLELTVDLRELPLASSQVGASELWLHDGEYMATCRQPDSADLAACCRAPDPAGTLLDRCARVVNRSGMVLDVKAWPDSIREAVDSHLATLDPCAEILLDLACPACERAWQAVFDPAAFLLHELEARAQQLLDEVDVLARAYGWSEAQILCMRPSRRRRYLELVLR